MINEASCKVAKRAGFELFEKRYPKSHKQPNMESDFITIIENIEKSNDEIINFQAPPNCGA